ncbi:uncharacterized protein LOC111058226 [Nilaparvata lugens]|uniref:uncharacterized protein LOC111058226 n=1 Tax=Nilaparvata lugens TaxID=108931 RepID=UPI00193CB83D|nr:uncharacterized protein LOC111058226 [Nilaparvata lugens]
MDETPKPHQSRRRFRHKSGRRLKLSAKPLKRRGTALIQYWASKRGRGRSEAQTEEYNDSENSTINTASDADFVAEESNVCNTCPENKDVYDTHTEIIAEERKRTESSITKLEGRRIVDINSFIVQIQQIDDHLPFHCGFKDMVVVKERRIGLNSCITLKCKMCNEKKSLWTNFSNENTMDVNTSAVSGTISTGGGHAQLEEVMSKVAKGDRSCYCIQR